MLDDVKILGFAERVEEQTLDEETYTFLEGVKNPFSCTVLVKGAHKHVLEQIKDAVRDGLRAVKNAIEDDCCIPGAGALEFAIHDALMKGMKDIKGGQSSGRSRLPRRC